jgi:L,D-transpeptidase ErfK/SrfK
VRTLRIITFLLPLLIARSAPAADSADAPPRANVKIHSVPVGKPHGFRTIVGELELYRAKPGETFLEIGRRADLGTGELEDANPSADPKRPHLSKVLILPSAFVIPPSRYSGLVINVPEMRLYYFPGPAGRVATFPIGVGPFNWQTPRGMFRVSRKDVNPTWNVPPSIQRELKPRRAAIPPGPDNPLGKYRLNLSIPGYGIHGTNRPWGVGRYYSHGCIRMYPEDIHWLFERVPVGFPVEIIYAPVKVGLDGEDVFLEAHRDPYGYKRDLEAEAWRLLKELGVEKKVDRKRVARVALDARGIPMNVSRSLGRWAAGDRITSAASSRR